MIIWTEDKLDYLDQDIKDKVAQNIPDNFYLTHVMHKEITTNDFTQDLIRCIFHHETDWSRGNFDITITANDDNTQGFLVDIQEYNQCTLSGPVYIQYSDQVAQYTPNGWEIQS